MANKDKNKGGSDLAKFTKNKPLTTDTKEVESMKNSIIKRLKTVDNFAEMIENTMEDMQLLGSPLSLAPGSIGYEDVIELYIKMAKVQKDLVESYRKLKITEFDIKDREQKVALRNAFVRAVEGKTLEEIQTMVRSGTFTPVNVVAGTLFGSAVVDGDTNAGRSIMSGLSDWGSEEEFTDAAPQLTVNLNLSDDEKERMRVNGEIIREIIDITPKEVE